MKTTKHLMIALHYVVLCFILVALPLHGQTSQVIYDNPEHTSGSLTLSASDCASGWWYYDWQITVPVNTPIRVTTQLYYETYLDAYTYTFSNYQTVFYGESPSTSSTTIITTTGSIYVYCEDWYGITPNSDVFIITFEVDSTIYSPAENLHVPGKLSVMTGLDVFGNTNIQGNTGISNKLAVGTNSYSDSKVYVYNSNKDNRAIYLYSNKSSTSSLYGLYSSATNNTGNVYGIYSTVSGVSGKKWSGYFNGGDVEINNANLRVSNDIILGTGNKQFIFHTQSSLPNNPPQLFIAPKISNTNDWDWSRQIILNHEGSLFITGGKLGVGTTQVPLDYKLAVAGKAITEGVVASKHDIDIGGTVSILNPAKTEPGQASTWSIFNMGGSYGNSLQFWAYDHIECGTEGALCTPRLVLMDSGNIGIGVSNPQHKLDVKGTIRATEVLIQSVDLFADFVFDNGYHLRPLTEVNSFIKNNKHLPDIPSAAEVKENGISLVEMQVKLLQKIEELTLYMIQQEDKIEELNAKIEQLEKGK